MSDEHVKELSEGKGHLGSLEVTLEKSLAVGACGIKIVNIEHVIELDESGSYVSY